MAKPYQPNPDESFESAVSVESESAEDIARLLTDGEAPQPPATNGSLSIPSVSEEAGAAPDLKRARRRKPNYIADRLPPNSIEAERGVLGCALLSPNESLGDCIEKLDGSQDFYDLRHQTIYEEMVVMYDQRVPIDIITLQQRLKDRQMLDQVGGIPYLNELQDATPSSANLSYYLDFVIEKALLRRSILACTDFVGRAYDFEGEADELMDELERDVMKLTQKRNEGSAKPIGDFVMDTIATIEAYANRQGAPNAIATGYSDLDRMMMGGLKAGEVFVIAARPSVGKTSLLMNIMDFISIQSRLPVGVFSLEMTSASLTLRMICTRARVNLRNITEGFMAESDFPKLTMAAGQVRNAPLYIDDSPGLSILQIRARARRMVQQYGIKCLGLDYMQLAHSTSKRARENRQIEISEISSGLKELAKELGLPIIVLSQLNRDIEKGTRRKPRLSDLRESGSIEQDADIVGLLYKSTDDEDDDNSGNQPDGIPINLLIAKQRNGPTGDVNLTFMKSITRFESAARVSDEDEPPTPAARQQQFPD